MSNDDPLDPAPEDVEDGEEEEEGEGEEEGEEGEEMEEDSGSVSFINRAGFLF